MTERLIMFSGTECVHCKEMHPLVEQLEKETGLKVTMLEVWHNAENAAFLESIDKNPDGSIFCGGIPMFYNEKTGKKLCGNQKYEKLKEWALGELK
ncbi:thioredoxin family protein [Candidatus Woesearchaeota archaeon]|nr:thioredoxin family protein [Candidatus Woesearchaeota archaeon]